jgi:hypothetical protein
MPLGAAARRARAGPRARRPSRRRRGPIRVEHNAQRAAPVRGRVCWSTKGNQRGSPSRWRAGELLAPRLPAAVVRAGLVAVGLAGVDHRGGAQAFPDTGDIAPASIRWPQYGRVPGAGCKRSLRWTMPTCGPTGAARGVLVSERFACFRPRRLRRRAHARCTASGRKALVPPYSGAYTRMRARGCGGG